MKRHLFPHDAEHPGLYTYCSSNNKKKIANVIILLLESYVPWGFSLVSLVTVVGRKGCSDAVGFSPLHFYSA